MLIITPSLKKNSQLPFITRQCNLLHDDSNFECSYRHRHYWSMDILANALLHSRATRVSRLPRFRLCSPKIRQKLRLFCNSTLEACRTGVMLCVFRQTHAKARWARRASRARGKERQKIDGVNFFALLPSRSTRVSRSPRFRLCLPNIRKRLASLQNTLPLEVTPLRGTQKIIKIMNSKWRSNVMGWLRGTRYAMITKTEHRVCTGSYEVQSAKNRMRSSFF